MKGRLRLAAGCACLALTGCAGLPFPGAAGGVPIGARGPVKVALVDVFTGGTANTTPGPYIQNSLQIQIDALNAQGGLLGSRVEMVTADDQMNPDRTTAAVKQLLADRSVKLLVGPSLAGLFLGVRPLVEAARVPNCLTAMAADDLMRSARYTFRAQSQDRANVPTLLGYLQRAGQARKLGLLTEEDGIGQDYDRQLSEQAGKYGIQYIGAAFAAPTADHKAQVQQLMKQGADAVVLSNTPATATKTLQAIQALKAGGKLKAFGFGGLASYGFVQQTGDAANGVVFTSTIMAYLSDVPEARWPPAYHDFAKGVLARYGPAANGYEMKGSPAAADCIVQWSKAVQAANDFDGAKVARAWEALDLPAAQSVLGVRERFAADDHDAVPPDGLCVYQWVKTGDRWSLKQLVGAPG